MKFTVVVAIVPNDLEDIAIDRAGVLVPPGSLF